MLGSKDGFADEWDSGVRREEEEEEEEEVDCQSSRAEEKACVRCKVRGLRGVFWPIGVDREVGSYV